MHRLGRRWTVADYVPTRRLWIESAPMDYWRARSAVAVSVAETALAFLGVRVEDERINLAHLAERIGTMRPERLVRHALSVLRDRPPQSQAGRT